MYYDFGGNPLQEVYDFGGNKIAGTQDYDKWETEFQRTILDARNAWSAQYRADPTIIPIVLQTDQHRHYNATNKETFDYLGRALNWGEIAVNVNLGDTCGAVYNTTDLNNMRTCLSAVPKNKQIHALGNHDVWAEKKDGSAYAYSITDQWDTLTSQYFEHSAWTKKRVYDNRGNVALYDDARNVKYCVFSGWYFGSTETEENQPYHSPKITGECIEYWIDMLSEVTTNDLIVLSHVQPINGTDSFTSPPVDGNEETTATEKRSGNSTLGVTFDLRQLISDRKRKLAGSITDGYGVVHTYDFTGCTSDILCWLSGHAHVDYYCIVDDVPVIVFDAMGYEHEPFFFVNVHRSGNVDVWKVDKEPNVYQFSVHANVGERLKLQSKNKE